MWTPSPSRPTPTSSLSLDASPGERKKNKSQNVVREEKSTHDSPNRRRTTSSPHRSPPDRSPPHRRHRSPSRSPRYRRDRRRDRSRDRYEDRRRDRDYRRRDRSRSRDRGDRRGGRPKDRDPAKTSQEEQRQIERTSRTVQVYNLSTKSRERDLFDFFRAAGRLSDIRLIKDRQGNSKGFAYVEFEDKESVPAAIGMSGQLILGQPVMVKTSDAEKNVAWEAAQVAKKQAAALSKMADSLPKTGSAGANTANAATATGTVSGKLRVSNLPVNLDENQVRSIFDPFGSIESVTIFRDAVGQSQGIAIVSYIDPEIAKTAMEQLMSAGLELTPGVPLQIVQTTVIDASNPLASAAAAAAAALQQGAAAPIVVPHPEPAFDERIDIDADDGGGMRLTAQSRLALMSRLAANAGIQIPQPQLPTAMLPPTIQPKPFQNTDDIALIQGVLGPASPIPTQCLLLKNMFDPEEERDHPEWESEIREDVQSECTKFGTVLFLHVDPNSKGFIYIKFDSIQGATAAQLALHHRWFNQKQIHAEFQFTPVFNTHFRL